MVQGKSNIAEAMTKGRFSIQILITNVYVL